MQNSVIASRHPDNLRIAYVLQDALIALTGGRPMVYRVRCKCPDCGKVKMLETFRTFMDAENYIMAELLKQTGLMYNVEQIALQALN
jgi:hypothetical protein